MHLVTDTTGGFQALGGDVLAAGPGQVLVVLLGTEATVVAHARALRDDAGVAFARAIQGRLAGTLADDLPALDQAICAAARALTTNQLGVKTAEDALAKAEQGVRDAFAAADLEAGKQFGDRGQAWWDGQAFRVRARAVDPAEEQRAADVAAVVAKARENPDFALLARLLGVDTSDEAAVAAAFAARRQG